MKIHQLTRIGETHSNHCEDYTITENLGPDTLLCAVMDGCTMGTDSYFADTLTGKLLRKIAIERNYRAFHEKAPSPDCRTELKEVLRSLMAELKVAKNQLFLNADELLSTLILAVFDLQKGEGIILTVGDGLVCINGTLTEYEQNNIPDYLGYHLTKDFDNWFSQQTQILTTTTLNDISLSTDGIFTFTTYTPGNAGHILQHPVNYLLIDHTPNDVANILLKKVTLLDQNHGLRATDDLGIIRIQF